jgi:hypothetical protein
MVKQAGKTLWIEESSREKGVYSFDPKKGPGTGTCQ